MKCPCGYEGIPTQHDQETAHWKCPVCHKPLKTPLVHDPMPDPDAGDVMCAMCGMRGKAAADLSTPCPGHGPHWGLRIAWCTCGEWGPAPKPPATHATCRRCGQPYPYYAPPPLTRAERRAAAGGE